MIFEVPLQAAGIPASYDGFPAGAVETVSIGHAGTTATLVRGAVVDGSYDPDFGTSLTWQTSELSINIRFQSASSYAARLAPQDLINIAESMR